MEARRFLVLAILLFVGCNRGPTYDQTLQTYTNEMQELERLKGELAQAMASHHRRIAEIDAIELEGLAAEERKAESRIARAAGEGKTGTARELAINEAMLNHVREQGDRAKAFADKLRQGVVDDSLLSDIGKRTFHAKREIRQECEQQESELQSRIDKQSSRVESARAIKDKLSGG